MDMPNNQDDLPAASPKQVQAVPVHSVAIKAPPFTTKNPALFFYALEAQFEIRNPKVTKSSTKFFHVVSNLPEQVLERIPDMLDPALLPPTMNPYKRIKDRLLSIYQRPIEERLSELIDTT